MLMLMLNEIVTLAVAKHWDLSGMELQLAIEMLQRTAPQLLKARLRLTLMAVPAMRQCFLKWKMFVMEMLWLKRTRTLTACLGAVTVTGWCLAALSAMVMARVKWYR